MKNLLLLICTLFPSYLRLAVWKTLGFQVGKKCHVSILSIVVADHIEIGYGSSIDSLTFIYKPSTLLIGDRARIGNFVRIIGGGGKVELGQQTFIGLGCLIDSSGDFFIGAKSQIGPRTMIYTHGSSGLIFNMQFPFRNGAVIIGENTWIGMGCTVNPSLKIGSNLIILPGLTVRKDQPDNMSLLPSENENRSVKTKLLSLGGVKDEILILKMREIFELFCSEIKGKLEEGENDEVCVIRKKNHPSVFLLSNQSLSVKDAFKNERNAIIWVLETKKDIPPTVTVFSFRNWIIYGNRSTFTEKMANFIMKRGGPYFLYKE